MSLQDEMLTKIAKEMADDLDWEVLGSLLGWVRVDCIKYRDREQAVDIQEWIDINTQGEYKKRGSVFWFEQSSDAEWFILRWQ